MDIGDLVHGPFDTRYYIEYLGGMFGYDFTLDTYHQLPQFFGHEGEDPCLHLDRFKAVCGLCDDVRMSKKLRCMFFPLSLQSVAGDWCYTVSEWVYTWEQYHQAFIEHFLPIHQTFTHGLQIKNFQTKGEVFYKSWERFNNLLETFPRHGLELGDIIAILYNALPRELHQAFDNNLDREFLDLSPSEAWSFLQFFYEHTRPQGRFEPSYESHALESHTEPSPFAPTSLRPYDPSLGSSICIEPDYSDFACPNFFPITEGQSEEHLEDILHQFMQQQLSFNDNMNRALDDLNEQISSLTQVMSTTQSGELPTQTESSTSDTTIGTEWDNCPNYTGENVGNKHLPELDSPVQEIPLPLTESQGDIQSFQLREEINLEVDSSAYETSTPIDSTLDDTSFESTACPYVRPLTETEIAEYRALLLLTRENPNLKTLNFEWGDCSDNGWDSEENEPFDSFQPDSKIPETPFVESVEDMPTNTTTELEAHPTLTTQMTLESPNTHSKSFNAISSGEHIIEPITLASSYSTTPLTETIYDISFSIGASTFDDLPVETPTFEWKYDSDYCWVPTSISQDYYESEFSLSSFESSIDRLESESGAHLSPHDLAPIESLTKGIGSDYHEIDHHWGEVVDIRKTCIDFLGVERSLKPTMSTIPTLVDFLGIKRLIEPTMSTPALTLWLHLRFQEPHSAFHFLVCFTPKEHPPSVFRGPEENILFLKPFVDVWDRVGIG